ncbi:hypothetical protein CC1G_15001 [Coprinopsis cinerea okayama7|uniref:Uncharacterized protein n=1 Tax=Coprinopsis cinerea (strain Okayama-7 / 130 / ATCC MYA-4618 / FGSC 9003) TaxID=240176 RepID=D6RP25_COPC7|nr:hypothetical protein CC1G_15001 [Coprinopsis cinerea okayama7\|eukprot:XP_002910670.1 hypothetical protein CC1G_15001 [Coprinopsis cinerea okayama7\
MQKEAVGGNCLEMSTAAMTVRRKWTLKSATVYHCRGGHTNPVCQRTNDKVKGFPNGNEALPCSAGSSTPVAGTTGGIMKANGSRARYGEAYRTFRGEIASQAQTTPARRYRSMVEFAPPLFEYISTSTQRKSTTLETAICVQESTTWCQARRDVGECWWRAGR